ncbi:MAG: hypothetical protein HEQ39_02450 [Rhizobacter sp.]
MAAKRRRYLGRRVRASLLAVPFLWVAGTAHAQESAANLRVGVNSQAIFVSGEFPPPLDSVVVRMAERAGQLSALHITHGRGTVVVPPNLIEGLVASTNVDLTWYLGADDKLHASIQVPCKGWSDKAPAAQACKKVFILIDGQLRRIISHAPTEGGNALTYTNLP